MFNLEIIDNFKYCRSLITFIYWLTRIIENNLSRYICSKFFNTQQRSLKLLYLQEENRFAKKLAWLQKPSNTISITNKKVNKVSKVKELKYFCSNVAKNY